MNQPAASELLHDGDGALADEHDRHRVGAHAVAADAARGVGGIVRGIVENNATHVVSDKDAKWPPSRGRLARYADTVDPRTEGE